MRTWAIVVAAGGGARFGAAKQFARLGDASVLDHSIAVARDACDGVVGGLPAGAMGVARGGGGGAVVVLPADATWDAPRGVRAVIGGATRSDSVRAGLALVPD